MASFVAAKDRLYVSGASESAQGMLQTLTKSFMSKSCSVNWREDQKADDIVTGYLAGISRTRISTSAAGNIVVPLHPAWAGHSLKFLFGSAPASSALVGASTTVYLHTWNAFTTPPITFSMQKQSAKIPTYTETLGGCGVKGWSLNSGNDLCDIDLSIEALAANYTLGTAEPSVTPDAVTNAATTLPYLVGIKTEIAKNGTPITKGFGMMDFKVNIEPGYALLDANGSTDGSYTRFDVTGQRKCTASFTLLEQDRTNLDDYFAQTLNAWKFTCTGPIIDVGEGLAEVLTIQLNKARVVGAWETPIGDKGVKMVKMAIESLIDVSTGFDCIATLQSLDTTY